MSSLRDKMNAMKAKLQTAVEESHQQGGDSSFWRPTVDEAGNGSAIIRFLPQKDLEKLPYVKVYKHWFKDDITGKTYDEKSLTTWGEADPLQEFNSYLWSKGEEDQARKQGRKLNYYTNVLVVKDPAKPENEGKVFVYRFGKKIYDKIEAQLFSEYDDDDPVNVFDLFEGKNFRLRVGKVSGFPNYDKSEFESNAAPVAKTDEEIEKILDQTKDLETMLLDRSKEKDYDSKLNAIKMVLGRDPMWVEYATLNGIIGDSPSVSEPASAPAKKVEKAEPKPAAKKVESTDSGSDSDSDSEVDNILRDLGL